MAKQVTHYICQQCGAEFPKWQGQCGQCGKWNSLVETIVSTKDQRLKIKDQRRQVIKPLKLSEIKSKTFSRIQTGIGELDRVLGGGIVPGSVVLVAGEPGIGKSTLLTQLALRLINFEKKIHNSSFITHNSVLYVCGEESPEQIKLRIQRVTQSLSHSVANKLLFLPETNLENILGVIETLEIKKLRENEEKKSPNISISQYLNFLIIIDSIQTLWTETLSGSAGSVGQVRQCSQMLLTLAKKTNIPIFLVGHITKEGMIAGPKVLEHLVDTVLYLEGDPEHDFRILRTTKNRFGPADEVGVFRMTDGGMEEIKDPSGIFLEQRAKSKEQNSGSAIVVTMQGLRPMLVEIQALVVPTQLAMPRRVASGIDYRRLQVICAVCQKHLHLPLATSDVFVNVAGGLTLTEPAADLAVALAITSSFKNKPLPARAVCLGELGLLGEIRQVSFMAKRLKECQKLGYKTVIGEKESNLKQTLNYLK